LNRTKLCYCIDVAMFLTMLGVASVGAFLGLGIGRGPHWAAHNRHLWGMSRHDWGDLHTVLALLFLALLAVHIALHWSWIVSTTRTILGFAPENTPQTTRGHGS